jgi:hypothetical protein
LADIQRSARPEEDSEFKGALRVYASLDTEEVPEMDWLRRLFRRWFGKPAEQQPPKT